MVTLANVHCLEAWKKYEYVCRMDLWNPNSHCTKTSLSTTHTQLCDKKRHNPNGWYSTRCHRSACRCLFATAVCMRDSEPPGLQKKNNAVLLGKPLTVSSSSEADSPNVYCYKLSMYTGSLQHSKVFSQMCCWIKRASAYSFKEDIVKLRNTSDPRLGVIHHSLCCLHIQLSKEGDGQHHC